MWRKLKRQWRKLVEFVRLNIYPLLLVTKMLTALIIARTTEFVPDEYWQSTEVSYHMLFGTGHLTWEWLVGIRSYVIPGTILGLQRFFQLQGVPLNAFMMTFAPQVGQAALTLFGIRCFRKFAYSRLGPRTGRIAIYLMIFNWFTTYCAARLISNQTEMSLNCIGLYLLDIGDPKSLAQFLGVLSLNFLIRPTAAIFWLPFIPETLQKLRKLTWSQLLNCFYSGCVPLLFGTLIDVVMYRKMIFTWWEFFKFNFLTGGSAQFGTHPAAWYFYSALPSILGPMVFFLPIGFFLRREIKILTSFTYYYIGIYSLIGHKEIRFMLPVLPLVFCVLGDVFVWFFGFLRRNGWARRESIRAIPICYLVEVTVMFNIGLTILLGLHHQSGIRHATNYIVNSVDNLPAKTNPSVWVLMPCYSVAVHAHLYHPKLQYEYYVCAPKSHQHLFQEKGVLLQPNGFASVDIEHDISTLLERKLLPPEFIMTFGQYVDRIKKKLEDEGFFMEVCAEFIHTYLTRKPPKTVAVLCRKEEEDLL